MPTDPEPGAASHDARRALDPTEGARRALDPTEGARRALDPTEGARRALGELGRDARTRLLAVLARRFGDLTLAEDCLQEALAQAWSTWPETGVPASPEAWLTTTAKRKAIDVVRREKVLAEKLARLQIETERTPLPAGLTDPAESAETEAPPIPDERLVLFFACAHPALRPEDRIALTLRFVAGLTTAEVATALMIPTTTAQQRIARAKKRISTTGIRFDTPRKDDLPDRLAVVLRTISLLYSEGYARSSGDRHIRDDLTTEAVRLARLVRTLLPTAESTGLLALLVLTEARREARTDEQGRPVPLLDQDRGRWDRTLLDEGLSLAERAAASEGAGAYAIQAAITAVHSEARRTEDTDWAQIAVLYRMLNACQPGPTARLGAAVAEGRERGFEHGLERLDALADDPALTGYRPYHVARALTLAELGRADDAAAAYRRALELPGNDAEDALLQAGLSDQESSRIPDSRAARS